MAAVPQVTTPAQDVSELLRVGTPLHASIVARLQFMLDHSDGHLRQREADWTENDQMMQMYLDLDRTARLGDRGYSPSKLEMPFQRSLMVPMTYWSVMTRVAQMHAQLSARDPLIHLEGRESRDWEGARLHEAVIRYHNQLSRANLVLWQLCYDAEHYGFSVLYDTWEEEYGAVELQPLYEEGEADMLPVELQPLTRKRELRQLLRQYTHWTAIDPTQMIIDGAVPLWDPQAWRFVGHYARRSWTHLKERERRPDGSGIYFNLDEARKYPDLGDDSYTGREIHGTFSKDEIWEIKNPTLRIAHVQVKVIPSDWELGASTYPETWWFGLVDRQVIVRAHRSQYRHHKYTYSIGMTELNQHSPFTPGTADQLRGLQHAANYILNTWLVDLRKRINDAMIYDPTLLEEKDILQPGPSRHIRVTRYGQKLLHRGFLKLGDMYGQLVTGDPSDANLQALERLLEFGQRVTAANDASQGQLFPEKRTLGEVEKAVSGSSLRVGVGAQLLDYTAIEPAAYRALSNAQQFVSQEQSIRIAGDLARQLNRDSITIQPGQLAGDYDYIPHTPTAAADPARQEAGWLAMMQLLGGAPQLLAPRADGRALNPHRLFDEWATIRGIRYIDRFYDQAPRQPPAGAPPGVPGGLPGEVRVVPDEQAMAAVQSGAAIPAGIAAGGWPGA